MPVPRQSGAGFSFTTNRTARPSRALALAPSRLYIRGERGLKTGSPAIKWIAFLAAGVFISSVAILIGVEQMYFMAAALFLTPLASLVIGWLLLIGLKAERTLPSTMNEGDQATVDITLVNIGRLPKFFMTVTDKLPVWLKETGHSGNVMLQLDADEARSVSYTLESLKRGVYSVGPVLVSATDPFGFFAFKRTVPGASELVVYPSPLPLFASLIQSGAYGWRGDADGLRRGSGADFHGVREYQHGDDLRRVHWRTTARTGKLAVAEYTQGETLDLLIALDLNEKAYAGTSLGLDAPIEVAVKIAATLVEDMTRNGHTVRLLTTTRKESDPVPTNDGRWSSPLLDALARAETTSTATLADILAEYRSQVNRGTMVIYLTPDGGDEKLGVILADYEALGALTAGFLLDRLSFGIKSAQGDSGFDMTALGNAIGGPVRQVQRGDDLVEAIHDLLGRGRGGRMRGRSAAAERVLAAAAQGEERNA